jgi:hypothetical protein
VPVEELRTMGAVSKCWVGSRRRDVKGLNPPKSGDITVWVERWLLESLGRFGIRIGRSGGAALGALAQGYGAKLGWSFIGSLTPARGQRVGQ